MRLSVFAAALLLGSAVLASAQTTLRVGDQKGNSQAVMEAAGVLKDVPYKIEWKEFPAAAPLLDWTGTLALTDSEALSLGGRDEGAPGDRGGGFYGAYSRDLDGNKLCFFHRKAA